MEKILLVNGNSSLNIFLFSFTVISRARDIYFLVLRILRLYFFPDLQKEKKIKIKKNHLEILEILPQCTLFSQNYTKDCSNQHRMQKNK